MLEHVLDRAGFYNLTLMKNCDAVAKRHDGRQVVRNEEYGHTVLAVEVAKQTEYLGLRDGIQCAGWLVRQQQSRAMNCRHPNQETLPHPDAQAARVSLHESGISRKIHTLHKVFPVLFLRRAVRAPDFIKMFAEAQIGIQGREDALRNQCDFVTADVSHFPLTEFIEVTTAKKDFAATNATLVMKEAENGHGDGTLPLATPAD